MHWHMQGGYRLITTPSALLGASKQEKGSQAAVVPKPAMTAVLDVAISSPGVMLQGSRMGLCTGSQEERSTG